jgi:phage major head subunit gpT-like protein
MASISEVDGEQKFVSWFFIDASRSIKVYVYDVELLDSQTRLIRESDGRVHAMASWQNLCDTEAEAREAVAIQLQNFAKAMWVHAERHLNAAQRAATASLEATP